MENEYLDKVLSEHGHHVFSKWNAPKNAVYIGRGSIFGNPFPMQNKSEQERERVCVEYRNIWPNELTMTQNSEALSKN